ncbi:ABC transporter ATP-binding protein/permease [Falcatimonas sp. MSJ-15]|uniref:ABC transporter ATP-binding protein n=1 Tax=Falcatimonas sp. MSJ-15 TaxID=2841515 RepID=UPI001C12624B|nr:ABC transporter ATP-binding protein [Falcatimonas sp. MSJ-15]MBU5471559.1 ABC transporter ATP-binding protein/permease [Falcatimonas sp. MSJ-15]
MKKQYDEDYFLQCYKKNAGHPLKTLLSIYKGNYYKFFLSTFFFVIKHSPVWVLPIVTANLINYVTAGDENTPHMIMINIGIMFFLILLNIPTNYLHTRFRSLAIRNVEAGLRGTLVRKLQQLSISYHTEMQSGRLQSKIMRDVEGVETLSSQVFVSLLNIILNVVVALSVTIFKSKIVFMFFLLSVPVAALTIVGFRKKIRYRNKIFRREMEETSAKVMEMVELIPVTRAHALEKQEVKKMTSQLNQVAKEGYSLDMIQSTFGSVSWAVFQIFQVVCLAFTSYLAYNKKIQVGDITLYQSYFSTVVNQVSSFITLFPTISKGLESVTSIGEVLLAHDIEDNTGKEKVKDVNGEFEFKDVVFSYKGANHNIIDHLNLKINKGETLALVGESGAGKSTILNLAIGFNLPDSGTLLIDGKDITKIDLHSYRKHLAVVPQNTILFSGSIRDNITYGMSDVSDERLMQIIKDSNLKDVIDSLPDGLDTKIGEHGGKLSGGQRQRISIARALIRSPEVIILDEATSALDSISEKLIQEALDNLTKNRTTIVVAHRLSTIRNADRIAVIDNGKCIEYGTYDELMALKGAFYKMKAIQS